MAVTEGKIFAAAGNNVLVIEKGKNKIKAVAVYNGKEYVDEIEWDYQSEKKRDADAHENKNEHAGW